MMASGEKLLRTVPTRGWRFLFGGFVLAGIVLLGAPLPAAAQSAGFDACLAFDRAACSTVLSAEPDNLTALFMRGLAGELAGDDAAALADFDEAATREPRHFGAQLWRHIAASSLGQSRDGELKAYLAGATRLGPWPRVLAELYLGEASPAETLAMAGQQPATARAEAVCAAEYHVGRAARLAGREDEAMAHFRAAMATGAAHVFEYQAAERAINAMR
jgi:lipoprotein NlpI